MGTRAAQSPVGKLLHRGTVQLAHRLAYRGCPKRCHSQFANSESDQETGKVRLSRRLATYADRTVFGRGRVYHAFDRAENCRMPGSAFVGHICRTPIGRQHILGKVCVSALGRSWDSRNKNSVRNNPTPARLWMPICSTSSGRPILANSEISMPSRVRHGRVSPAARTARERCSLQYLHLVYSSSPITTPTTPSLVTVSVFQPER
jgi:hypothetical protein